MKAIWVDTPGNAAVLKLTEIPNPVMKAGHVRIKIRAAALNRADLLQRRGLYPPPAGESEILGLEASGEVLECAANVQGYEIGERVCALLPGGGYAQEAVVPAGMLAKIPDNLSFEEAAAIPEAYLTAYSNLVWLGGISPRHRILVHAGASGVGTAALQLIRAFGASAIVTAGTQAKRAACLRLGADVALDYHTGPFVEDVLSWSNGQGVDIIFDFIGAPYLQQNLRCLAVDGRLIVIGTMGGAKASDLDLGMLLARRLQIIGTALRSRSLEQKVKLTQEFWGFAFARFQDQSLRPIIDRIFPLADAADAHLYMESNQNIGKIVLRVD